MQQTPSRVKSKPPDHNKENIEDKGKAHQSHSLSRTDGTTTNSFSSVSNAMATNERSGTGFSETSQECSTTHQSTVTSATFLGENSSDAQFPDTVHSEIMPAMDTLSRSDDETPAKRARM